MKRFFSKTTKLKVFDANIKNKKLQLIWDILKIVKKKLKLKFLNLPFICSSGVQINRSVKSAERMVQNTNLPFCFVSCLYDETVHEYGRLAEQNMGATIEVQWVDTINWRHMSPSGFWIQSMIRRPTEFNNQTKWYKLRLIEVRWDSR